MVVQPTQLPETETPTDQGAAGSEFLEADLSSLLPPALLVSEEIPSAVSVEGQTRTLRVLDADTVVVVEPASDVPEELAVDEAVVIVTEPLLTEPDFVGDGVSPTAASAAEEHSHAAPPPLTQPGEVVELLGGTEALAAMDALAPFELPAGYDGGTDFLIPRSEFASTFTENSAAGGDLIFLDFTPFAKPSDTPGNGGGKGGGKGGGGGGDDDGGGGDSGALSEHLSGDPNVDDALEYNILVEFEGDWSAYAYLQDAFIWAADWISSVITDDIQDVFYRGKVIDDLQITAELTDIDGTGGILGQAGPTAIRTDGYLPATGVMEFDSADAQNYYEDGLWDDIVLHEMLHTVGFGTIWDYLGLVSDSGTLFLGSNATDAYETIFDGTGSVPLEDNGGAGTAGSHWEEGEYLDPYDLFDNEIMTGFINNDGVPSTNDDNYMSGMTVASLTDLGYGTVSWNSGDWSDPLLTYQDPALATV